MNRLPQTVVTGTLGELLVQHAELEAEVLYPAAVLTGKFVAMKLAARDT